MKYNTFILKESFYYDKFVIVNLTYSSHLINMYYYNHFIYHVYIIFYNNNNDV